MTPYPNLPIIMMESDKADNMDIVENYIPVTDPIDAVAHLGRVCNKLHTRKRRDVGCDISHHFDPKTFSEHKMGAAKPLVPGQRHTQKCCLIDKTSRPLFERLLIWE